MSENIVEFAEACLVKSKGIEFKKKVINGILFYLNGGFTNEYFDGIINKIY